MLNLSGFMCFVEGEIPNFILKFMEIFLWRETVFSAQAMKSDEKPFFCQIYAIFLRKMIHVVIDRYFSLFLKGLMIFLNPRLALIVSLSFRLHTSRRAPCNSSVTVTMVILATMH